jgi:hypothetical protein
MNLIVWSVCFGKSLLPLSTLRYSSEGGAWCTISRGSDNNLLTAWYIWNIISYVIYPLVCMGLIAYWSWSIRNMISNDTIEKSRTVTIVLDALYIYPVTVIFCFGVLLLVNFVYICGGNPNEHWYVFGESLITIHGFLVACVFFTKSKEGRDSWLRLCPCVDSARSTRLLTTSSQNTLSSAATQSVKDSSITSLDLRSSTVDRMNPRLTAELSNLSRIDSSEEKFIMGIVCAEEVI